MNKFSLLLVLLFILLSNICLDAQSETEVAPVSTQEEFENQYERNIRKSRINGVYIPIDINDAIEQLKKLSPPASLEKFKGAEEDFVVKQLHFGLGGWITYKWNFYEGSRFEHYLKKMGLGHPEEMADFVITCLHRDLNGKELNVKALVEKFKKKRLEELKKRKVIVDTIYTIKKK